MSRFLRFVAAFVSVAALSAQEAESQRPVLRTGTTAVVLDVVVRDRRGQPVRDIQPSELTVLEDGMAREVRSFRLVERSRQLATEQSAIGGVDQPDALRYPALVTLVFDHLTQNGRALARGAALQFVARELPSDQWVAVYGLEQRLRLTQPFTRDPNALRRAIDEATSSGAEIRDHLAVGQADQDAASRAADAAVSATAA